MWKRLCLESADFTVGTAFEEPHAGLFHHLQGSLVYPIAAPVSQGRPRVNLPRLDWLVVGRMRRHAAERNATVTRVISTAPGEGDRIPQAGLNS